MIVALQLLFPYRQADTPDGDTAAQAASPAAADSGSSDLQLQQSANNPSDVVDTEGDAEKAGGAGGGTDARTPYMPYINPLFGNSKDGDTTARRL